MRSSALQLRALRLRLQFAAVIVFGLIGLAMGATGPTAFLDGLSSNSERPRQVVQGHRELVRHGQRIARGAPVAVQPAPPRRIAPSLSFPARATPVAAFAPRISPASAPPPVRGPPVSALR